MPRPRHVPCFHYGIWEEHGTMFNQNNSKFPPPATPRPRPRDRRRGSAGKRLLFPVVGLLTLIFIAGLIWFNLPSAHSRRADLITSTAHRQTLRTAITEHGTLESARYMDVVCKVKARTHGGRFASTIIGVIPDGTTVKRGDVLCRLDSSAVEEDLKQQRIALVNAHSDEIQSIEARKIIESETLGDIDSAAVAVRLAELDLRKFVKADYPQSHHDLEGRLAAADADREMSRDRAGWAHRMQRKGFLTYQQALAETSRQENLTIAYDKINEEMRVLEGLTRQRTQTELEAKSQEAGRAFDRSKNQAVAKKLQADITVWAKKSIRDHEEKRLSDLEEQLRCCTIAAPQDGIVVYFNSFQARSGSGSQQAIIAQGEPVREGQRLMRIPSLSRMVVDTYVHEAALTQVHADVRRPTHFGDFYRAGLIATPSLMPGLIGRLAFDVVRDDFEAYENEVLTPGDAAEIHLHAFPGRILHGHVQHISSMPSQRDWALMDVKLYPTTVTIDDLVDDLKPGLTADVTILGEKPLAQVLAIPLEALVKPERTGLPAHCFVLTPLGPEERDVAVGMQSQNLVQIRSGVAEGEEVILNPAAVQQEKNPAAGEAGIH